MNANKKRVVICILIIAILYLVFISATVASFKWGFKTTKTIVCLSDILLFFLWSVPLFYKLHRDKFCSVCGKKGELVDSTEVDITKGDEGGILYFVSRYRITNYYKCLGYGHRWQLESERVEEEHSSSR